MEQKRKKELAWFFLVRALLNKPIWALGEISLQASSILREKKISEFEILEFTNYLLRVLVLATNHNFPVRREKPNLTKELIYTLAWEIFTELLDKKIVGFNTPTHCLIKIIPKPPSVEEEFEFKYLFR